MTAPPGALPAPASTPSLAAACSGTLQHFDSPAGRLALYTAGPDNLATAAPAPLLLVHSINAAGSAYEVRPIYEALRQRRRVAAIDLPGFGHAERSDRPYTPRLMTDAVIAAAQRVRALGDKVDMLGVSLGCEFVARAAIEQPALFGHLALVSPTGFSGRRRRRGPPGSTLALPRLHAALSRPLWAQALFDGLTRPGVIRFFLEKTWGSKAIDEGLWAYDVATTRQPGAHFAPLHFLSAGLFSNDINTLYEALPHPVWMSHGSRGDFVDYRGTDTVRHRPNWRITRLETGALPHFEILDEFVRELEEFLDRPGG